MDAEAVIQQYLTTRQLAERLGVSESWLLARAAKGEIPSIKMGGLRRFPEDEIAAWLKAQGGEVAGVRQLRSVS